MGGDYVGRMQELGSVFVSRVVGQLGGLKSLAERAMAQVSDAQFFAMPEPNSTSIATNVKHIAGNMRSRWTEFLSSDGEKSWRHRDQEFVPPREDRAGLMKAWDDAWALTLETIGTLRAADLLAQTSIRSQQDFALQRVLRQVGHYSYHVGQIVYVARMQVGDAWQSLSVPLGGSDAYNASLGHAPEESS